MAKPNWITLSRSKGTGKGSVQVTASKNTGSSPRSGTLTIKTASGLTQTVSLSQAYSRVIHYWATIEYLGESGSNYRFAISYHSDPGFSTGSGDSGYLLVAPIISSLDGDLDLVFSDAGARIDDPDDNNYEVVVSVPKSDFVNGQGEPIDPNEAGWSVSTYSELENNQIDTQYIFDVDKSQYINPRSKVYYQIYPNSNSDSAGYRLRMKCSDIQSGTFICTVKYKTTGGGYETTTVRMPTSTFIKPDYGAVSQIPPLTKADVADFDITITEVTGGSSGNCDFIQEPAPNPITLTNTQVGSTTRTFTYQCKYTPLPSGLTMDVVDTENNQRNGISLSTTGSGTFTVPKNDSEGEISINSITIHPTAVMGCLEIMMINI